MNVPTSALEVWPALINLCWQVQPRRILDVGPGHGKAAVLLREYIGTVERGNGPIEHIAAVEAEPRYVDLFPWLGRIYDEVIVGDACELPKAVLDRFDLVVMSDVIEHMERDAALALIDRIDGHIVISTPAVFFQNPEADAGWETERHRSHWSAHDFPRVEAERRDLLRTLRCVLVRLGRRNP